MAAAPIVGALKPKAAAFLAAAWRSTASCFFSLTVCPGFPFFCVTPAFCGAAALAAAPVAVVSPPVAGVAPVSARSDAAARMTRVRRPQEGRRQDHQQQHRTTCVSVPEHRMLPSSPGVPGVLQETNACGGFGPTRHQPHEPAVHGKKCPARVDVNRHLQQAASGAASAPHDTLTDPHGRLNDPSVPRALVRRYRPPPPHVVPTYPRLRLRLGHAPRACSCQSTGPRRGSRQPASLARSARRAPGTARAAAARRS